MEVETNTFELSVNGNKNICYYLKDTEDKCNTFLEELRSGAEKSLADFRNIINNIEVSEEFNYYFLKYLRDNNLSYEEEGEKWDYKLNFEMLKDTLTAEHLKILDDPLYEIKMILFELSKISDKLNKVDRQKQFETIVKKYSRSFNMINFPLIGGIERLRLKYYRELILNNDISKVCKEMRDYISIMDKDKDIFDNKIDDKNFNKKTYLLMLTLTETFKVGNSRLICNFFTKKISDSDIKSNFNHIKQIEEGKYLAKTNHECRKIQGKDYILSGLNRDLEIGERLPIDFLLLRNESYEKFENDGGKGFISKLGLYNQFISYIKTFIKSKAIQELLKGEECFMNNEILLKDDYFLNEMLSERYFGFIPFYGSKNFFGFTNKDIMISFINSIPTITDDIELSINADLNEIKNIYHICLLFAIGEKFVTSLHEFAIHLITSYIHFASSKKLSYESYKEKGDEDDDGFFFERKITGEKKFELLNINTVIVLLDGDSCTKELTEFQNKLNGGINIDNIIERHKAGEFKGFLKDFLEKYPIDFEYFRNFGDKNPSLRCRGYNGVGISMQRNMPDTYGVEKSKNKEENPKFNIK